MLDSKSQEGYAAATVGGDHSKELIAGSGWRIICAESLPVVCREEVWVWVGDLDNSVGMFWGDKRDDFLGTMMNTSFLCSQKDNL